MSRVKKWLILILILMISLWKCHALRCQLEDGPSEDELKKVVRICMRKLGDNSNRNSTENSYEDSNSDENDDSRNNNRGKNNNNNNSRGNRFARDVMDQWQQQKGYGDRNQKRYDNGYGSNGNNGFNYYGNDYGNTGSGNNEYNRNVNQNNRNRNEEENGAEDKSCMIQCFFHEMKMTNSEGFPDKHKVERIVTQDVRDREMKNFLLESIQECFHIVEMERRHEKCVFSKNIVSCLAERAKANCDDYYNETMIFRRR